VALFGRWIRHGPIATSKSDGDKLRCRPSSEWSGRFPVSITSAAPHHQVTSPRPSLRPLRANDETTSGSLNMLIFSYGPHMSWPCMHVLQSHLHPALASPRLWLHPSTGGGPGGGGGNGGGSNGGGSEGTGYWKILGLKISKDDVITITAALAISYGIRWSVLCVALMRYF
jgi:hypothetical protein